MVVIIPALTAALALIGSGSIDGVNARPAALNLSPAETAATGNVAARGALPMAQRRMEKVVLRSTSSSPPLPKAVEKAKRSTPRLARRSELSARGDHVHIHEHDHDHGHRHHHHRHRHGRHHHRHHRHHRRDEETAEDEEAVEKREPHSHDHDKASYVYTPSSGVLVEGRPLININARDVDAEKRHSHDHEHVVYYQGRPAQQGGSLIDVNLKRSPHSGHYYDHHDRHGHHHDHDDGDSKHVHVHSHKRDHDPANHSDHWYQHHKEKGDLDEKLGRHHHHHHGGSKHVHVHSHSKRDHDNTDHSDHWYQHHKEKGDLDEKLGRHHHHHGGSDHVHVHSHSHKRGLLSGAIKPLLAPLNAIPGFVTISDLLFGTDSSDGLVKKVASLVLHAEPAPSDAQPGTPPFRYSLMASKSERSQVWLVPTDDSSTVTAQSLLTVAGDTTAPAANDTMIVKVVVPLLNATTSSPMTWCATFNTTPPSPLQLQPCSNATDASQDFTTSQRFSYTPSSGVLAPLYAKEWTGNLSSVDNGSAGPSSADPMAGSMTATATAPAAASSPAPSRRQLSPSDDLADSDSDDLSLEGDDADDVDPSSVSGPTAATTAPLSAAAKNNAVQLNFIPAGLNAQAFAVGDSAPSATSASSSAAPPMPAATSSVAAPAPAASTSAAVAPPAEETPAPAPSSAPAPAPTAA